MKGIRCNTYRCCQKQALFYMGWVGFICSIFSEDQTPYAENKICTDYGITLWLVKIKMPWGGKSTNHA